MSNGRSRALDAWDYRAPFARYHIAWGENESLPAFEQMQAYGIALQELELERSLEVLAHREVLATVVSEHLTGDGGPLPAWVVIVAGRKRAEAAYLQGITEGGGVVVQALVHARSGEILLGTAVPVRMG
ncbi:MAG: hypothetical protein K0R39_5217 [Symbiobacteriaceae bacterium]|jgi:hypothetical protein|nr:hypothetical protein [Symbiobacteriaceae bacterium]